MEACPDYELRQAKCEHAFAVEFVLRRETAPDGTLTETRAMRVTYAQNWPAYNAAQTGRREDRQHERHSEAVALSLASVNLTEPTRLGRRPPQEPMTQRT